MYLTAVIIRIFGDFVCSIYVFVDNLRKRFFFFFYGSLSYLGSPTSAAARLPSLWGEKWHRFTGFPLGHKQRLMVCLNQAVCGLDKECQPCGE